MFIFPGSIFSCHLFFFEQLDDNMLPVVMITVFNFFHQIKRIVRIENSFNPGNWMITLFLMME
jgi:hypothetical protein